MDDITEIIQKLDTNKAHGHNKISMHLLKVYGNSIYKPIKLIFQSCIEHGKFPSEWKKAYVLLVHKQGNKQTLGNYCILFLLPIFVKISERFWTLCKVSERFLKFFVNQCSLINSSSEYKVRGVFLDIAIVFDRVLAPWIHSFIKQSK